MKVNSEKSPQNITFASQFAMLEAFTVENFRSLRDRNTLNLIAAPIKDSQIAVYENPHESNNRVLKSVGLFGNNASGKSNLLKAIAHARDIVVGVPNAVKKNSAFSLSEEFENKPSSFEFLLNLKGQRLRYGFAIQNGAIQYEYLYQALSVREDHIFLRNQQGFSIGKKLKKDLGSKLDLYIEMCRPDVLFLNTLSYFNYNLGIEIVDWFSNILIVNESENQVWFDFTSNLLSDDDLIRRSINAFITNADLGIQSLSAAKTNHSQNNRFDPGFISLLANVIQGSYDVKTKHTKSKLDGSNTTINFDMLLDESSGTIKLFSIIGPILYSLRHGNLVLVDELDSKLHSLLFEQIYNFYNQNSVLSNGNQLVFSAHNLQLFKKQMRRDQMILFEKDEQGISSFKSLHVLKPSVRHDASFDKDYLQGKYDAIPKIANQLRITFDD